MQGDMVLQKCTCAAQSSWQVTYCKPLDCDFVLSCIHPIYGKGWWHSMGWDVTFMRPVLVFSCSTVCNRLFPWYSCVLYMNLFYRRYEFSVYTHTQLYNIGWGENQNSSCWMSHGNMKLNKCIVASLCKEDMPESTEYLFNCKDMVTWLLIVLMACTCSIQC